MRTFEQLEADGVTNVKQFLNLCNEYQNKYFEELVMNDVDKLLADYAVKLGIKGELPLDALLDSHWSLREDNKRFRRELNGLREAAYEEGLEMGMKKVTEFDYIKREKLLSMTVPELVEFLTEPEC